MDNISDIISSLSDKDIENLKDMAQSVFGQSEKEEKNPFESGMPDLGSIDPKIIGKVTKIMSSMNKQNPRCNLITALKPLLNRNRQQKADEAIQIIRLLELIPMIKDNQE